MPLLAAGSQSAAVVHIGREQTTVVGFLHGRLLRNSIRVADIGVRHACEEWHKLLSLYIHQDVLQQIAQSESASSGADPAPEEVIVTVDRDFSDLFFFQFADVGAAEYLQYSEEGGLATDGEDSFLKLEADATQVKVTFRGEPFQQEASSPPRPVYQVPKHIAAQCMQCIVDGVRSEGSIICIVSGSIAAIRWGILVYHEPFIHHLVISCSAC